ncbi:MAG: Hemerythrin cation binding domain protein [Acidobacteria bacterium]|nr:Hemerythrin cation binding domain protein [Acidobacteriota bacterium]
MRKAIEELVAEHHLIEELLSSLEKFVERLGRRPDGERAAIRDYAFFFHQMVDVCHHGKEEKHLFVKMDAYGFSREKGPVSAMLSEQDEGRDHLDALTSIGNGLGPLSFEERENVRGHALGYIMRIRIHMSREEDVLFPIVEHSLPDFVLEELAQDFGEFEKTKLPAGFHENLRQIADSLRKAAADPI